jgi:periplasmic mercuric ion binding protein
MKTLKISSLFVAFMAIATISFAQTKTETFKVSGNCGMCKSKIEKAAKEAGAAAATWDVESKQLTVKYNSTSTNTAKIQKKIAGVGYDNVGFKATAEAYDKLHGCCKYERNDDAKAGCCSADKCEMKDGKCTDMKACKDKACCTADGVCKAGTCTHENDDAGCCKKSQ